jgi:osmotically-inducible protein OsmY
MRQSTYGISVFGAVSIGTLAIILWAAFAAAEEPSCVFYQTSEGAGANARIETDRNVVIVTPGRVHASNDAYVRESALQAHVAAKLAASRSLSGSSVVVTSTNGTIVLGGSVAESADLARAELIARRTPGVVGVVNQLRVRPNVATPTDALDDAELAKRVSERLTVEFERAHLERRWEYGYGVEAESMDVNVDADDGEVMLSGTVASYDALGRAVSIARAVPGVQAVRCSVGIDTEDDPAIGASSPRPFEKPQHRPFVGRLLLDRDYKN